MHPIFLGQLIHSMGGGIVLSFFLILKSAQHFNHQADAFLFPSQVDASRGGLFFSYWSWFVVVEGEMIQHREGTIQKYLNLLAHVWVSPNLLMFFDFKYFNPSMRWPVIWKVESSAWFEGESSTQVWFYFVGVFRVTHHELFVNPWFALRNPHFHLETYIFSPLVIWGCSQIFPSLDLYCPILCWRACWHMHKMLWIWLVTRILRSTTTPGPIPWYMGLLAPSVFS